MIVTAFYLVEEQYDLSKLTEKQREEVLAKIKAGVITDGNELAEFIEENYDRPIYGFANHSEYINPDQNFGNSTFLVQKSNSLQVVFQNGES